MTDDVGICPYTCDCCGPPDKPASDSGHARTLRPSDVIERLQAERDAYCKHRAELLVHNTALEQRAERAEAALREIAEDSDLEWWDQRTIAREALRESTTDNPALPEPDDRGEHRETQDEG